MSNIRKILLTYLESWKSVVSKSYGRQGTQNEIIFVKC